MPRAETQCRAVNRLSSRSTTNYVDFRGFSVVGMFAGGGICSGGRVIFGGYLLLGLTSTKNHRTTKFRRSPFC